MRCHPGCPVHSRRARRRYRRFMADVAAQVHIAWAATLVASRSETEHPTKTRRFNDQDQHC